MKRSLSILVIVFLICFCACTNKPSKCDCAQAYEHYLFEGQSVSKWSDCVHSYKEEVNDYLTKQNRSLAPDNSGSFAGAWESGAYDFFKNNCDK